MKIKKVQYDTKDGIKIVGAINIPKEPHRGGLILCHGITVDKDENGKFINLANRLCNSGFGVLRFDFRGHGESDLTSEEMTLTGELLDIEASVLYMAKKYSNIGLLAASFGAGPAILYAVNNPIYFKTMVLWNPVLDYDQTFLKPKLPWGKSIFNKDSYRELEREGFVTIPGKDFRISKQLVHDFSKYKPFEELSKVQVPVLTIHGTNDTKVPYWVSEKYGTPNKISQFISVETDHGFGNQKDYAIQKTVEWFEKFMP